MVNQTITNSSIRKKKKSSLDSICFDEHLKYVQSTCRSIFDLMLFYKVLRENNKDRNYGTITNMSFLNTESSHAQMWLDSTFLNQDFVFLFSTSLKWQNLLGENMRSSKHEFTLSLTFQKYQQQLSLLHYKSKNAFRKLILVCLKTKKCLPIFYKCS